MAFYSYLGTCSNNMAECMALLKGLQWYIDNGFNELVVESDSLLLVNMINVIKMTQAQVKEHIHKIRHLMAQGRCQFQHCYREANIIADKLASIGLMNRQERFFTQAISLSRNVKALLKNDQRDYDHFRMRTKSGHYPFDNV
ncbi:uncharacterized protein LOC142173487 [Nicotiana tabacum]|uniref:Uncharacterized protein LOC142173487 n=1 Tax=Nicotiana tabacum TaxID=4097 RepID=A0AC58TD91_TOBAC